MPPGDWPGIERGFDMPEEENVNHVPAPRGAGDGPDHHDWEGESEVENNGAVEYEGDYEANADPEEWAQARLLKSSLCSAFV